MKNKQTSIANRYKTILGIAEEKHSVKNSEISSLQEKQESVREFTDWLAQQRPIIAGLLDPIGSVVEIEGSIEALKKLEAESLGSPQK